MAWAFFAENVNNVNNDFTNFFRGYGEILNNTVVFPTFQGILPNIGHPFELTGGEFVDPDCWCGPEFGHGVAESADSVAEGETECPFEPTGGEFVDPDCWCGPNFSVSPPQ